MNDPASILAQLLRGKIDQRFDDVHISMPGRVEAYDIAKQKVSVQPLIRRGYIDERGERATELLPVVHEVPVEFFGAGDYALTFPIAKGMTCRLQCGMPSLDRWLVRGGEVDPEDERRFALSDAVAVFGMRDFAHALANLPSDAWVMSAPTNARILLGSVFAAEPPIKGTAHNSAVSAFLTALSTYVTGIKPVVDPTNVLTPPMLTAIAALSSALAGMLSTKVRIE